MHAQFTSSGATAAAGESKDTPPSKPLEQRGREIPLGKIGQYRDDAFARHLRSLPDLDRGGKRGTRGDTDRHALEPRHLSRGLDRGVVADADDLVDELGVEDRRNESSADALDLVRARRAAREHGAVLGLDRDHAHRGLARLQYGAYARESAPRTDATHDDIDRAAGVFPDLLGRGAAVDLGIGGVLELLRDESVWPRALQRFRARDRALHALRRRRELELRAQ